MKKKLFIACDTTSVTQVKKILKYTKMKQINIGYKFGLEFFNSKNGRLFISRLKNKEIWLDLKLHDIPNTVASSIYALKDIKNLNYITVHASGGLEMMRAAKKAAKKINKNLNVLGVTILTSFTDNALKKTGHTKKIKKLVIQQAQLVKTAGLDGIICSAHEIKLIRKICKKMIIICPGIRLAGDNVQDQSRVMTPDKAFKNNADAIVVGRSITIGNIKKNIHKLINSLK
jgi:orotidine-5'-phosphate decarboxylase